MVQCENRATCCCARYCWATPSSTQPSPSYLPTSLQASLACWSPPLSFSSLVTPLAAKQPQAAVHMLLQGHNPACPAADGASFVSSSFWPCKCTGCSMLTSMCCPCVQAKLCRSQYAHRRRWASRSAHIPSGWSKPSRECMRGSQGLS